MLLIPKFFCNAFGMDVFSIHLPGLWLAILICILGSLILKFFLQLFFVTSYYLFHILILEHLQVWNKSLCSHSLLSISIIPFSLFSFCVHGSHHKFVPYPNISVLLFLPKLKLYLSPENLLNNASQPLLKLWMSMWTNFTNGIYKEPIPLLHLARRNVP